MADAETFSSPGFGDGIFGRWFEDADGLPAYRYTLRHDDPAGQWKPGPRPTSGLHWHQIGNARITANAYNLGLVQVFYGESGALWLNRYAPADNAHGGGFGWLIAGDTVLIDRDDCVPESAAWERVFGVAYLAKRLAAAGLIWRRRVYAPAGDLPVLVSEVTVTNTAPAAIVLDLIEYWDVYPQRITASRLGQWRDRFRTPQIHLDLQRDRTLLLAVPRPSCGAHGGFPSRATRIDPELPATFLASLDAAPTAWITDPDVLFARGRPRAAADLATAGTTEVPRPPRRRACLAARVRLEIAPGESRSLRFLYGYAKGRPASEILARGGAAAVWAKTAAAWRESAPTLRLPGFAFLSREIVWDDYYLASASQFDAYAGQHHIPQGGNYLYDSGWDGAARDTAACALAQAYYRPAAARAMLTWMMHYQDAHGRFSYAIQGYGRRAWLPYRPSDLGLWFLWALCEYLFATRDFAFLDESVPYYPRHKGQRASVWGHALQALDHLCRRVGIGRHGHLRLGLSDWNDEMTWLTARDNPLDILLSIPRGESVLNTAMACHILPMVRALAARRDAAATVERLDAFLAGMRRALAAAWNGEHLLRSYSGRGRAFGDTAIWLEPQVWALLAEGALGPEREQRLVQGLVARLKEPSDLGMMVSSLRTESLTTRAGEQESGGVWFALNGPAAVALSRFDPHLAWDILTRNTLAWHAQRYPALWYGIWSGPDAWNGPASERPGQTWYQHTPLMDIGPQLYPVQNTHAHCQTLYAVARLAGITPTAEGWTIQPRIPHRPYTFACALCELEVALDGIGGVVRPSVATGLTLQVHLPAGLGPVRVIVDGQPAGHRCANGVIVFPVRPGQRWRVEKAEGGAPSRQEA